MTAKIRISVTLDVTLDPGDVWPDGPVPDPITEDSVRQAMAGSLRPLKDGEVLALDGNAILNVLREWNLGDDVTMDVSINDPKDTW